MLVVLEEVDDPSWLVKYGFRNLHELIVKFDSRSFEKLVLATIFYAL